jgi:hypothetical protein
MNYGEGLFADDMRLILKAMDALNSGSDDTEGDICFIGTILVQEGEVLKGVIHTDEEGAFYVPSLCRDCIPATESTESDGAK